MFILCGSAWQDKGVDTIKAQVQKYSGLVPIPSENTSGSRINTLNLVQDFIRWEQKPRPSMVEAYDHGKAQEIYRRFGDDALNKYVNLFKPYEPENNLPKLQILSLPERPGEPIAPVLADTIPVCVYSDKKTEDIAEFDGDDPIDNLRYICKFAERYIQGVPGDLNEVHKRTQAILQEYNTTSDVTRFYRRMEALENLEEEVDFGVRRRTSRRLH
jgi:hypothetical protein